MVYTGSLSNLAVLLLAHPDIKDKVELLSIMGGAIRLGNESPSSEYNIYTDPEAAKIVFAAGFENVFLATLDITHTV